MDYLDWVHRVMGAITSHWKRLEYSEKETGIDWHDLVPELGFEADPRSAEFQGTTTWWAMIDALRDLEEIGWLEKFGVFNYKVSSRGELFPEGDITSAWQEILDVPLGYDETSFLEAAVTTGEERYDDHVLIREIDWQDVFTKLGWPTNDREDQSRAQHITRRLEDAGMIRRSARVGGTIRLTPRYIGAVRATRRTETEDAKLVRELVADDENTNVEIKRQIDMDAKGKAKLVSRIMGLATTRARGRRFLVVGFDDKTRELSGSVDMRITKDRLEHIVHTYCQPPIQLKYTRVPYLGEEVGLIEVFREPQHVPYTVVKPVGGADGIKVGQVFVRHSSRTEEPTPLELQDLLDEGKRAKRGL